MYTITLGDGTKIKDMEVSGTTFVSDNVMDYDIFLNNLSPVTIERIGEKSPIDESNFEGVHENMELCAINEHMFALIDIPESELRYSKIVSDIEYIAMMTDVEL